MFGLDATELLVLVIVGIVVVGPKKLPQMMRTAGQWVAKLRRLSTNLRSQSGIDEILRIEGLEKEMRELRALTRINVMDTLAGVGDRPLPVRAPRQLASSSGGAGAGTGAKVEDPTTDAAAIARSKTAAAAAKAATASDLQGAPVTLPAKEDAVPPTSDARADSTAVKPPGAPPPGAVPRAKRAPVMQVDLPGERPLPAREWPIHGCDAYDALPDDLDETEDAAESETTGATTTATAEVTNETTPATTGEAQPEPLGDKPVAPPGAAPIEVT